MLSSRFAARRKTHTQFRVVRTEFGATCFSPSTVSIIFRKDFSPSHCLSLGILLEPQGLVCVVGVRDTRAHPLESTKYSTQGGGKGSTCRPKLPGCVLLGTLPVAFMRMLEPRKMELRAQTRGYDTWSSSRRPTICAHTTTPSGPWLTDQTPID